MNLSGSRDLAWWRFGQWIPTPFRTIATMLLVGLVTGLGGLLGGVPTFGLHIGLVSGSVAGLIFGLVFEFVRRLRGTSEHLTRIRPSRFP